MEFVRAIKSPTFLSNIVVSSPKCRKQTPAKVIKEHETMAEKLVFRLASNSCPNSKRRGSWFKLSSIRMIWAVSVAALDAPLKEIEMCAFLRAIASLIPSPT